MGEDRLHVVFGTGHAGSVLAAHLETSHSRPPGDRSHAPGGNGARRDLPAGIGWRGPVIGTTSDKRYPYPYVRQVLVRMPRGGPVLKTHPMADSRDMVVIHDMFRREFKAIPPW